MRASRWTRSAPPATSRRASSPIQPTSPWRRAVRSASEGDAAAARYLLSARAVRERSRLLFDRCRNRLSDHFTVDEGALDTVVAFVIDVTREAYPELNVPYHSRWRHFEMGGVDRWTGFAARLPQSDA